MNRKILPAVVAIIAVIGIAFCARTLIKRSSISVNEAEISEETQSLQELTETSSADITKIFPSTGLTETQSLTDPAVPVTIPSPAPSTAAQTKRETVSSKATTTTKAATTTLPPATSAAEKKTSATGTSAPVTTTVAPKTTTQKAASDYEYAYAGFNPQLADLNVSDWRLILVNRDYILPEGFEPPELVHSVKGDSDSKLLDSRVAPHYNEMYLAAQKDGIDLYTVSGYRSYSRQKTNFENKISTYMDKGMSRTKATQEAATIILPPGTSEHNLGFAMDICSLEQSFENSKAFAWLKENAEDYGFILRYPKDKQDVTKIIYEPWHWRYVGVENAKAINASGKCLEEYLGKA